MNSNKSAVLFAVFFLFFTSLVGYASAQESKHPLDVWFANCVAQDDSTAGQRNCYGNAYGLWDEELNLQYKNLMKRLDASGQKVLKASQASWLKFRDAESKLSDLIVNSREGTMWLIVGDGDRMEFIKKRALELKRYREILDE
ncbi:MAG: lysozyme inhibitor LprI family protein [Smithellaceae bacterium]